MLVYGPLALSDAPALAFLALALAAAARLATAPDSGVTVRTGAALGAAAAGAVGCRPQLALAVLPMLLAALLLRRSARGWLAAGVAFAFVCTCWFVPLAAAAGGLDALHDLLRRQAATVATFDAALERTGMSAARIFLRFVAHPWGPKWTALPVLALAAAGAVSLVRGRWRGLSRAVPLLILSGVELAFALRALHPADAARYALPSMLAVALLAALGVGWLAGRWAWTIAAVLMAGFVAYTAPLLALRSTRPSPPVEAAGWVRANAPPDAFVLYEAPLAAHAWHLLARAHAAAQTGPPAGHRGTVLLFADGASGAPGEVSFAWPASDAWGKLTRGHYRVASVAPVPPARLCLPLRGVLAMEPDPRAVLLGHGEGWRWLAPDAALALPPAGAVVLRLGLPAHAPVGALSVDVRAGSATHRIRLRPGERRDLRLALPCCAASEVSFTADGSFVPAERGLSADRRRLAVQLLGCELAGSGVADD
jgi:hypothetical protein